MESPSGIPDTIQLVPHPIARDKAIANVLIKTGFPILSAASFATILLDSEKGKRCDSCFRTPGEGGFLKKCTGCGSYWYCNAECQASQWKAHHKRICRSFNSFISSPQYQGLAPHEKYDSLLLSHVVAQMSLLPNPYSSEGSALASTLLSLIPGTEQPSSQPLVCPIKPPPPDVLVRKIYAAFGNNNFAIHSHLYTIGHGVFPIPSRLFNHSCLPNAAVKYTLSPSHPVSMDIVALRDINPGEEICIPYLDPGLLQTREQILEVSYGFKCRCPSCSFLDYIKPLPELPADEKELSRLEDHLCAFVDIGSISALKLPYQSIEQMPPTLYCLLQESYMTTLSDRFSRASHEIQYDVALRNGLVLLSLYLAIYPINYPQIGMHLLELAKTTWNSVISDTPGKSPDGEVLYQRAKVFLALASQVLEVLGQEGDTGGPMEEVAFLNELLAHEKHILDCHSCDIYFESQSVKLRTVPSLEDLANGRRGTNLGLPFVSPAPPELFACQSTCSATRLTPAELEKGAMERLLVDLRKRLTQRSTETCTIGRVHAVVCPLLCHFLGRLSCHNVALFIVYGLSIFPPQEVINAARPAQAPTSGTILDKPPTTQKKESVSAASLTSLRPGNVSIPLRGSTIVTLGVIASIFFIMSISMAFLGADEDEPFFQRTLNEVATTNPGIVLVGESVDVDIDEPSITIRWSIAACGEDFMLPGSAGLHGSNLCGLPSMAMYFFVDSDDKPAAIYDPLQIPFNKDTGHRRSIQNLVQFDSDHVLDVHEARMYPFDTYMLSSTIRAVSFDNQIIPIRKATTIDVTSSFDVMTVDLESYSASVNGTQTSSRDIDVYVSRPNDARFFTLLLFAVSWVLTHVTIGHVLIARRLPDLKSILPHLVSSAAILIAIPQLRKSMPDAPGLDGVLIDCIGFFPQMIISGISTVILLLILGVREFDAMRYPRQEAYPVHSMRYRPTSIISQFPRPPPSPTKNSSSREISQWEMHRFLKHLKGEYVFPPVQASHLHLSGPSQPVHRRVKTMSKIMEAGEV